MNVRPAAGPAPCPSQRGPDAVQRLENTTGTRRGCYGEKRRPIPVMDPVNPHAANLRVSHRMCPASSASAERAPFPRSAVPTAHVPAQVIMVSRGQVVRWGCAIVTVWLTLRDVG